MKWIPGLIAVFSGLMLFSACSERSTDTTTYEGDSSYVSPDSPNYTDMAPPPASGTIDTIPANANRGTNQDMKNQTSPQDAVDQTGDAIDRTANKIGHDVEHGYQNTKHDVEQGYKNTRHDVEQGYKNTKNDIKKAVGADTQKHK